MILPFLLSCIMLSDIAGKAMIDYHLESDTLHQDYPEIIVADLYTQVEDVYPLSGKQERSIDGFRKRWYDKCENNEEYYEEVINE